MCPLCCCCRRGRCPRRPYCDGRRSATVLSLDGQYHVVVSSQLQACRVPRLEVRSGIDGAAGSLGVADGPELGEGGGALDRRLVLAYLGADLVLIAVLGEVALELGFGVARAWPVVTVVIDDVVLD